MYRWLRVKFLQLRAAIFGGDVVYLKILKDRYQIVTTIALPPWDPFDQDTRPVVQIGKAEYQLNPNGSFGPVYSHPLHSHPYQKTDQFDRWKYASKRRQTEHVLKNGG